MVHLLHRLYGIDAPGLEFSGPGTPIYWVCLCVWTTTFELDDP